MLKTYRFISYAFILFLFGFTLIIVSPVFAEDSPEFLACQQMKWNDGKKAKKNCFRDLARQREGELQGALGSGYAQMHEVSQLICVDMRNAHKTNRLLHQRIKEMCKGRIIPHHLRKITVDQLCACIEYPESH